jgi:hypothetical protein
MKKEVLKHVASFLEASPSQVQTWDDSVVKHLVNNPGTLQAFKAGCDTTKWNIYRSIKYRIPKQ